MATGLSWCCYGNFHPIKTDVYLLNNPTRASSCSAHCTKSALRMWLRKLLNDRKRIANHHKTLVTVNVQKHRSCHFLFTGPRRTVPMLVIIYRMKWRNSCTRSLIYYPYIFHRIIFWFTDFPLFCLVSDYQPKDDLFSFLTPFYVLGMMCAIHLVSLTCRLHFGFLGCILLRCAW